ncbi:MAG: nodulation protein NodH [Alphaproteobacteria bacterium]|nr:MAG: nodulation protein NodH [Alphaproteobacteria bacterium]
MARPFDYFVILADMRTGSNLLEESLNQLADVHSYGEVFNPAFIGHPKTESLFGIDLSARETSPLALLGRIREETEGLPGFRLFGDHDPRVLDFVLNDPRCGKIVLGRNPLEAYVSLRIAAETGQWRLGDARNKRAASVRFDAAAFHAELDRRVTFRQHVQRRLQVTGQAAFWIDYEDLSEIDVLNGVARFLGSSDTIRAHPRTVKKQNPESLREKVANPEDMERAIARLDPFGLDRTPSFEPAGGARVPSFRAGHRVPILHMPLFGGPVEAVDAWLAALDGTTPEDLVTGFTQKTLRQWKKGHPGFRAVSVLRHPLRRAYHVFCHALVPRRPHFAEVRRLLIRRYGVPLPEKGPGPGYDAAAHREAFKAFLRFLKMNLSGQTSIRVDRLWGSQTGALSAFAAVGVPDLVIREDEAPEELPRLAARLGLDTMAFTPAAEDTPFPLAEIWEPELESLAEAAYRRDYVTFGFGRWAGAA